MDSGAYLDTGPRDKSLSPYPRYAITTGLASVYGDLETDVGEQGQGIANIAEGELFHGQGLLFSMVPCSSHCRNYYRSTVTIIAKDRPGVTIRKNGKKNGARDNEHHSGRRKYPIAEHYGFDYPHGDDARASAHLRHVQRLPRDAQVIY
jgi:hypothetical protein